MILDERHSSLAKQLHFENQTAVVFIWVVEDPTMGRLLDR